MRLYRIDMWNGVGWTHLGLSVLAQDANLAIRTCRDIFGLTQVAMRAKRVLA